jgi:hypothetical protein
VTVDGPARAAIHVYRWDAESRMFTAEMSAPDQLALRLFQLSGVASGSERARSGYERREGTGQMLVPVAAGMNRVEISFVRTWDRTLGGWISIAAMAGLGMDGLLLTSVPHHLTALCIVSFRFGSRMTTRCVFHISFQDILSTSTFTHATSSDCYFESGEAAGLCGSGCGAWHCNWRIPGFASLPAVVEDGLTFEENARKKAEGYSRHAAGEIVVADDSGLEVDALQGAPGVHSARYAADQPHLASENTDDEANNARVLRELRKRSEREAHGTVCLRAGGGARWADSGYVSRDGRRSDSRRAAGDGRVRI